MSNYKANPNEIVCIQRTTSTLAVEAHLAPPPKNEDGSMAISPLKDSPFSRFVFTYIEKGGVRPKANLPLSDVEKFMRRAKKSVYELCENEMNASVSTDSPNTPAYTVKLTGKYAGKTVAEILTTNSNEKDGLLRTKDWLNANLAKYPRNKDMIDAINDGIKILDSDGFGEAVSTVKGAPSFSIYNGATKYFRTVKDGMNLCYKLDVAFDAARKYPYTITINNFYAPLDGKTIKMSEKTENVSKSIYLTEEEFCDLYRKMNDAIDAYKAYYCQILFQKVLDEEYHP